MPANRLSPTRILVLALMLAFAACGRSPRFDAGGGAHPVRAFADVAAHAQSLAGQPWVEEASPLPATLLELDYDTYRKMPFLPNKALWRDSGKPFEIGFYHPGYLFKLPVRLSIIGDKETRELKFDESRFGYYLEGGAEKYSAGATGYAGFLAMYPFDGGPYRECVSFLGSSYFRAVGARHVYGISARGLAMNIGRLETEVFPRFTEFWILEPKRGDESLRVLALLDGPAAAGAYEMTIAPGETTSVRVHCRLFFRSGGEVGLAPLTSMFFHAQGHEEVWSKQGDTRPNVHDSEGLLIHDSSGEWVWRPLKNPFGIRGSTFEMKETLGFGLIQRTQDADAYQDKEALYDRRPSAWVKWIRSPGEGRVELLELPAPHEGVDNIAAYWAPRDPFKAGDTADFEWVVDFRSGDPPEHVGTRAKDFESKVSEDGSATEFRVHFADGFLDGLARETAVEGMVSSNGVSLKNPVVTRSEDGREAVLEFSVKHDAAVRDIRAAIKSAAGNYSETWVYRDE